MAEPGDPLKTEPEAAPLDDAPFDDAPFDDVRLDDALFDDASLDGTGVPSPAVGTAPVESLDHEDAPPAGPAADLSEPAPAATTHDDHDDLIGFSSAAALTGVSCPPGWGRPAPVAAAPVAADGVESEPDLFDPLPFRHQNRLSALRSETFGDAATADRSRIDTTDHVPTRPDLDRPAVTGAAAKAQPDTAEGAMGLFAVYALLLGAVPTLGASALVALVAVTVRPRPAQPLARSHFDFQKRTVWIAAVTAVVGAVLIALNLGVFVLFFMAVWMLARSAWGLMALARGETIRHPRQWLIADLLT
jgi:uncharacterized membrane protein